MTCARTLEKYHAALNACKAAKEKVIEVTRSFEQSADPNKAAIKKETTSN